MTKFRKREREVFLLKPNRKCTIWRYGRKMEMWEGKTDMRYI